MAHRGTKPQTREQKLAKGETRPSRLPDAESIVEFPMVANVPKPPECLNAEGQALWTEIVPILFSQRILTTADVHSLSHLCELHGQIVDGYKRKVKPSASELAQVRMYFSEFGMTPSSRTRIAPGKGIDKTNPFKKHAKPDQASRNGS